MLCFYRILTVDARIFFVPSGTIIRCSTENELWMELKLPELHPLPNACTGHIPCTCSGGTSAGFPGHLQLKVKLRVVASQDIMPSKLLFYLMIWRLRMSLADWSNHTFLRSKAAEKSYKHDMTAHVLAILPFQASLLLLGRIILLK